MSAVLETCDATRSVQCRFPAFSLRLQPSLLLPLAEPGRSPLMKFPHGFVGTVMRNTPVAAINKRDHPRSQPMMIWPFQSQNIITRAKRAKRGGPPNTPSQLLFCFRSSGIEVGGPHNTIDEKGTWIHQ